MVNGHANPNYKECLSLGPRRQLTPKADGSNAEQQRYIAQLSKRFALSARGENRPHRSSHDTKGIAIAIPFVELEATHPTSRQVRPRLGRTGGQPPVERRSVEEEHVRTEVRCMISGFGFGHRIRFNGQ